jgi:hypothetical protein
LADALNDIRTEEQKDLVKALDMFILLSYLGEFEECLSILRSCPNELLMTFKTSGMRLTWKLQQFRILGSIWKYYCQYHPLLSKKLQESQAPGEAKLKNEFCQVGSPEVIHSLSLQREKSPWRDLRQGEEAVNIARDGGYATVSKREAVAAVSPSAPYACGIEELLIQSLPFGRFGT